MLFANGVCERDLSRDSSMPSDLVMICQWASLFTQSMDSRMTICSGGSNGSAALVWPQKLNLNGCGTISFRLRSIFLKQKAARRIGNPRRNLHHNKSRLRGIWALAHLA